MSPANERRLELFPITTKIVGTDIDAHLTIANCDLAALAERFGTPLYLYDQASMDAAVAEYRQALDRHYPGETGITYAGKAFMCVAAAQWVQHQNLLLDCTGAGELRIAAAAGVNRANILVHGVNKSPTDLAAAMTQAGVIVLELAYVIWFRNDGLPVGTQLVPRDAAYSSTRELGQVLYTLYLYPFELAAMLLLLAIVAAILLTMRKRQGLKLQDISAQVRVRREDRVRIVKMKPEAE